MGDLFEGTNSIVQLLAGLATVVGVLLSINALSVSSRSHSDVVRWTQIRESEKDSVNSSVFESLVNISIARLIAIREVPTIKLVIPLVILAYVFITMPLLAAENLNLHLHYTKNPDDVMIRRTIGTELPFGVTASSTISGFAFFRFTEYRIYRAKVLLAHLDLRDDYDFDTRATIRTKPQYLTALIVGGFATPIGWAGLCWLIWNRLKQPPTEIAIADHVALLVSLALFLAGSFSIAWTTLKISKITALQVTNIEDPWVTSRKYEFEEYIRAEQKRRIRKAKKYNPKPRTGHRILARRNRQ